MLYLDKVLTQLVHPLMFSLCVILVATLCTWDKWRKVGRVLTLLGLVWLWVWSTPVFSDWVCASLEGQYANIPVQALPDAEAIVVLGGGLSTGPPSWPYPDLGAASDRIWHAARIYDAGKAPFIVLSGHSMPWSGQRSSVAAGMENFLQDLGVPKQDIVLENKSLNTWQNALYSSKILQQRNVDKILLVTSALHMRRALRCFQVVDLHVVPAATDFEVMPEPNHILRWLPDAEALHDSSRALKEYLGFIVYWVRHF